MGGGDAMKDIVLAASADVAMKPEGVQVMGPQQSSDERLQEKTPKELMEEQTKAIQEMIEKANKMRRDMKKYRENKGNHETDSESGSS
jgi:hypothetical protein